MILLLPPCKKTHIERYTRKYRYLILQREKSGQIVVKKLHQISHNQILARPRRANELIAEQQKALDKGFGR